MTAPFFTKPDTVNAVGRILPTAEQTWLLRACLYSGEPARQAWEAWRAIRRNVNTAPEEEGLAVRSLRLLFLHAHRRNGVAVENGLLTLLRTAELKEELRYRIYCRITRNVLDAFASAGLTVAVIKGAALAETVYPEPKLRHCHDLDLLVRKKERDVAARLLGPLGFKAFGGTRGQSHLRFDHESGLPVELHTAPFRVPYYNGISDSFWKRSRSHAIMGCPVLIPSAVDSLMHVCVHASYCSSRHSLRWISDAWFILDRNPGLDWDYVVESARKSRSNLPLWITLRYLAEKLDAPVPPAVLESLRSGAMRTDRVGRDLALLGAKAETLLDLRKVGRVNAGLRGYLVLQREKLFDWAADQSFVKAIRRRWEIFCRLLRRAFTPGDRDRAIVALPDSFLFLYYLLRPIRLVRENGLTGVIKDLPKFLSHVRD